MTEPKDIWFQINKTENLLNRFFACSRKAKTAAKKYQQQAPLLEGKNIIIYSLGFQALAA